MRWFDVVLGVSLVALGGLAATVARRAKSLPRLEETDEEWDGMLSVIVPARDEEATIGGCAAALLDSTPAGPDRLEVLVVDDRSTDRTAKVVKGIRDPRLRLLSGQEPPEGVFGKDWACEQGYRAARGDRLLFVDADFTARPGLLEAAVRQMERDGAGLLGLYPRKRLRQPCEWWVEPLLSLLHLAHPRVGQGTFTPGWFMLFRREAYEAVGGHLAAGGEILEDLALARKVKEAGLGVTFCLAPGLAELGMYDSWSEMYEGYTKNFFCGADHRLDVALGACGMMAALFVAPWVGLAAGRRWLAGAGVALHWALRQVLERALDIPARGWWTTPVGGALLVYLNAASAMRGMRGTGTWKGAAVRERR